MTIYIVKELRLMKNVFLLFVILLIIQNNNCKSGQQIEKRQRDSMVTQLQIQIFDSRDHSKEDELIEKNPQKVSLFLSLIPIDSGDESKFELSIPRTRPSHWVSLLDSKGEQKAVVQFVASSNGLLYLPGIGARALTDIESRHTLNFLKSYTP